MASFKVTGELVFRDLSNIQDAVIRNRELEIDRKELLEGGKWVTNGADENQLIYLSAANIPVTLVNGRPITINVRDLNFFDEDLKEFREQIEGEEIKKAVLKGEALDAIQDTLEIIEPGLRVLRRKKTPLEKKAKELKQTEKKKRGLKQAAKGVVGDVVGTLIPGVDRVLR